jgi:hypothetical protein
MVLCIRNDPKNVAIYFIITLAIENILPLREHSHMTLDAFGAFLTYLPTIIHRDLEQMEPKVFLLTPSEGGKLVILLHNST